MYFLSFKILSLHTYRKKKERKKKRANFVNNLKRSTRAFAYNSKVQRLQCMALQCLVKFKRDNDSEKRRKKNVEEKEESLKLFYF